MPNPYLPLPGTPVEELDTPALIVDLDAAEANIEKMAQFGREHGVGIRPHAKTHKSAYWGHRQMAAGAIGLTCAKVGEAEALIDGGITKVFIANEVVGKAKIARLMALARRADVMVAVDDPANVDDLSAAAVAFGVTLSVVVDVNVRIDRCGVEPGEPATTLSKIVARSRGLRYAGLMGYEGHITGDPEARRAETMTAMNKFLFAREEVLDAGLPVGVMSSGGTSTFDITGTVEHITDLQSGSYIFMDGRYLEERQDFEPALTVLSTIISRPTPDRAILDIGRKSINAENGLPKLVGLPDAEFYALNEEHGKMRLDSSDARQLRPGDHVSLLPMTAATTINIHDYYFCVRNGVLEDVVPITGRGQFR